MKKIFVPALCMFLLFACKENKTTESAPAKDSTAKTDLPYAVADMQWQPGSSENTVNAMKALKAFENGNIQECLNYMADSVRFEFEGIEASFVKDSARAFLQKGRDQYKSMMIKMEDFESVKSKDGKSEYVSLWYKQYTEDVKGKKDSMEVMNDVKMHNGKITMINEKSRRMMSKKM